MSDPVKLWRYYIPSEKYEGWAVIHMDSKGFFAACSDFGNYAYHWGDFGEKDFRRFVIGLEQDPNYIGNKLDHDKWYQGSDRATIKNIKQKILRHRREKNMTSGQARDHWDLLMEYADGDIDFREWICQQGMYCDLSEAADCRVTEPSADLYCFCTKLLPRLCKLLREELEAEATAGIKSESQTA